MAACFVCVPPTPSFVSWQLLCCSCYIAISKRLLAVVEEATRSLLADACRLIGVQDAAAVQRMRSWLPLLAAQASRAAVLQLTYALFGAFTRAGDPAGARAAVEHAATALLPGAFHHDAVSNLPNKHRESVQAPAHPGWVGGWEGAAREKERVGSGRAGMAASLGA